MPVVPGGPTGFFLRLFDLSRRQKGPLPWGGMPLHHEFLLRSVVLSERSTISILSPCNLYKEDVL